MGSLFKLWIPGKRMYLLTLSHSDGRMSFCWGLEYGVVQSNVTKHCVCLFQDVLFRLRVNAFFAVT